MKTVKLASAGYLDTLPTEGNKLGQAFRDPELEEKVMELARKSGIGAQFGGKYFALDARVIRLPRHGASCPVGIGVSCSADRNIKARIDRHGIWLEELERDPARFIPAAVPLGPGGRARGQGRPQPADEGDPGRAVEVSHLHPAQADRDDRRRPRHRPREDQGAARPRRGDARLPEGPSRLLRRPGQDAEGMPSGSFGPTTAGRMDSYVDLFQSQGGSMVMIAKGNRSKQVTDACKKHGGFYLGSIGGPAAILAQENIKKVELLEFPELGMEAVYKIDVVDFPAFILVDDKGNDFFMQLPVVS